MKKVLTVLLVLVIAMSLFAGCGNVVEDNQNSNEIIDEPQKQNNVCKNCGEELYDDAKFCPNCGEDTTTKNELEVL